MRDAPTLISASATVVAVLAAIWSTCKAAKAHRDSFSVQKALADIETARERDRLAAQKKAELRAEVCPDTALRGRGGHKLKMFNEGLAEARNIDIALNGEPFEKHSEPVARPEKPGSLRAEETYEYYLAVSVNRPFNVEIGWDDDSGIRGHWTGTFTG